MFVCMWVHVICSGMKYTYVEFSMFKARMWLMNELLNLQTTRTESDGTTTLLYEHLDVSYADQSSAGEELRLTYPEEGVLDTSTSEFSRSLINMF